MPRLRTHRRAKKKPKTTIVSPDSIVNEENHANDHPLDDDSEEFAERLEFSTDDRRKVRAPVVERHT